MHPRAASHDPSARPTSPAASLGVPIGTPGYAGASARTAHAPSAEAGNGGDAPHAAAIGSQVSADDALGSDAGADLLAGGALLETGLAQRAGAEDAFGQAAPFVPSEGMPTDGADIERVRFEAAPASEPVADQDDGLTADGPGPMAPSGDVEAGGDISDSVDEGAGMDGSNAPTEAAPADAGASGSQD